MTSAVAEIYFPCKNGKPIFATKLETVLTHTFCNDSTAAASATAQRRYNQGIIARDTLLGTKEYLAVNHFTEFIEVDCREDRHLYELLPEGRPVRPYFDLEWDPAQLDEEETLLAALYQITAAFQTYGLQGSLSIYCASGACTKMPSGKKASYHIICDMNKAFRNTIEHGLFMKHMIVPLVRDVPEFTYKNRKGDAVCVIDGAPYMRNQVFRLPYQSKRGTNRRLLRYDVTQWDVSDACAVTVGIYSDVAEIDFIDVYNREAMITAKGTRRDFPQLTGKESPEYDKVAALCTLLTPKFLTGYLAALDVIYCLWSVEQTARMKALIHTACSIAPNYEHSWVEGVIRSWKFSAFTIGSLIKWARDCTSVESVARILENHVVNYKQELFHTTMIPAQHTSVSERYMTVTTNAATILIKSHLGTGKTVWITNLIRTGNYKRILIVSPRKSYTYAQHGIFLGDTTLPSMESYLELRGDLSGTNRLIVQVESLHRIGTGFQPYDLVILDEVESILNQLHSIKTNGGNLITNHEVLGLTVHTAQRVILSDAFLSDRAFHFCRALRGTSVTEYIENTFQPYKRVAILLKPVGKDRRVANLGGFCERICDALRAGRRVVVLWTSKRRGEQFVKEYLEPMKEDIKVVFYNSDSSKEEQESLRNVTEVWSSIQCLMMTTSITVGISYDPKVAELEFDEAFLYGSSASAMPRDIAQGLLRVRNLKANRLTYVMDTRVSHAGVRGFDAIRDKMAAKEDALLKNHPLVRWTTCPEWARWNYCYNENEERNSRAEYKEVLETYLVGCGYGLIEETHVPAELIGQVVEIDGENDLKWENIDDISWDSAEGILGAMKRGEADGEMILCYKKCVFKSQFMGVKEEAMKRIWEQFYEKGREARFWNVVRERRCSVADIVRDEAAKRYGVMATGSILERETLGRFLELMGMRHSQECVSVAAERLMEISGKLEGAERELREGMGLRQGRRKGEWKVANAIDLIGEILEKWGDGTVETILMRPRIGGKQIKQYSIEINKNNILWDSIQNSNVDWDESHFIF